MNKWPTVGKSKAKEVVEKATGGSVEDIAEHDIHAVFGADWFGAEHGEHQVGGKEEVHEVESVGGVD